MISDDQATLTENQRQLTRIFQQARESINLLHGIASRCEDPELRDAALRFLVTAGASAAAQLVCLASDPKRNAEVLAVAAQSNQWPLHFSTWPGDRKKAEKLIPRSKIGSGKAVVPGKGSLETPQFREAFRFTQHMQAAQIAKQRFADTAAAASYLFETHSIELPHKIIELAASLPPPSRENLVKWQDALWKYTCHRYGGDEAIRRHPDWHHLPKTVEDKKRGASVPKSVVRQKLDKSLAQALGVTRK